MLRRRISAWWILALLAVLVLPAPALAGREVGNDDGKLDGIYDAQVQNRTRDTPVQTLEVEVEGKYIHLRFPGNTLTMRIQSIFDRAYQYEITARNPEAGDLYIVQIDK